MTLNELLGNYKGEVEFEDVSGVSVAKSKCEEAGELPILKYIGDVEVVSWQAIQSSKNPRITVHCAFIEEPVSI